ncbi:MAG: DUF1772 domain-containing protein [Candidatus Pristimantibacillus sp.]
MMDRLLDFLTFFSALGSGLVAGLFFVFSAFMMTVLARLPSAQGIATMQSINIVILNPLFALVFMGTALATLALAIMSFFKWGEAGVIYLLAGSLFYLVGSILVTTMFNIPLNDALAKVDPHSAEGTKLWNRYLSVWTSWNHVRTISTLAALASFIIAFRELNN